MAKTRAEIQKAYRDRKKAANKEEYLKKEAIRAKRYYVPTEQMSATKLCKRRAKIRKAMQKHRLKKTVNTSNAEQTDENNNSQENSQQSHEVMDINDEPGPCDLTLSGDQIRSVHSTPIQEENQRNVPFKVKMTFKPKEKNKKHEI